MPFITTLISLLTSLTAFAYAPNRPLDSPASEGSGRVEESTILIMAEAMRVRDLNTGREYMMEVPRDARPGDVYDVQVSRSGRNPGIDTSETNSGKVRNSTGEVYDTKIPRNSRNGDTIYFRKR